MPDQFDAEEPKEFPYEVWNNNVCVTATTDITVAHTSYLREITKVMSIEITEDMEIGVAFVDRVSRKVSYLNRGRDPYFEETPIVNFEKEKKNDEPTKH